MARADKYTLTAKKKDIYSDFLNNFDMNPNTGYLAKVTNEDAVKQSLRNLVLTNIGERFYAPYKGSRIRHSLFEPVTPITIEMVQLQLGEVLALEPRANIIKYFVSENIDRNAFDVTIVFSVVNLPGEYDLSIQIKRVR